MPRTEGSIVRPFGTYQTIQVMTVSFQRTRFRKSGAYFASFRDDRIWAESCLTPSRCQTAWPTAELRRYLQQTATRQIGSRLPQRMISKKITRHLATWRDLFSRSI